MRDLLDITDDIARARHMIALIQMTCVSDPDDDQKAISEGCEAALERLNGVLADLRRMNMAEVG